ncbi:ribosomal-processing cysteine protease Prp [Schnuerera sp. xch1]|uniref:ribosomal-processing cysteine protease Prp n=1 Tax=Schnuerera sp. xch1 TaxID=2874283 RepID=UPI001CBBD275|nr:ribosomal-processing cysteine protease Prp [Schnuerera sp. xch1]MBZ2175354.1 ribosomal-processing cysteine protease Prp [Schnuerera sp. xch1]
MIEVTIFKDNKGYIQKYNVSGHADYDVIGKDIVCAAVSMLAQTTLNSLIEVCKLTQDQVSYFIEDENGVLEVIISKKISMEVRDKVEIVLKTFEVGIKSIISNYSEYVTLKYKEV